jgi:anthranilate synthase component I
MKNMSTILLHLTTEEIPADTFTPVNLYYTLRDIYAGSILLESSDYHGKENALSFICCAPIASFKLSQEVIEIKLPLYDTSEISLKDKKDLVPLLSGFFSRFSISHMDSYADYPGFFGYMSYDVVRYFEDIDLDITDPQIPDLWYTLYKYVIRIDHFHNTCRLYSLDIEAEQNSVDLNHLKSLIHNSRMNTFPFSFEGPETYYIHDERFLDMVENGKNHCQRGDVFQVVLSRRFKQKYKGDDFNVYRALRSVNPSPYLFYFDYGSFRLMGSSPESQIRVQSGQATIYPIAGTFRRTGNDAEDATAAFDLVNDPKENAEHIMLVDLARNDLSTVCEDVEVKVFREVQYFSHVIHLVSEVTGHVMPGAGVLEVAAKTFPAGTLSGAPKHRAMQIINETEPHNRGYYGGAIGIVGMNGSFNHAIMIRSLLSKDHTLYYQAGAGIVSRSVPEMELQEVQNKLGALRKAIRLAADTNTYSKTI